MPFTRRWVFALTLAVATGVTAALTWAAQAPTVSIEARTCTLVVGATVNGPDGTSTGWRLQARLNGQRHGSADTSSPYGARSAPVDAGTYLVDVVWTKNGVSQTQVLGSAACTNGRTTFVPVEDTAPTPVAPAPSMSAPPSVSAPSPSSGTRTLLTPADVSYVGEILLPEDNPAVGTRFGWSRGTITGRRVGTEVRLFITGSIGGNGDGHDVKDAVYEVRVNDVGQRATLVRNWGDVTQGRKAVLRDGVNGNEIRGLLYSGGFLWWAYGDSYFSGSEPNPSIGASQLNDSTGVVQAYGPWRTAEHSQKTRGYMTELPADYAPAGGRRIAVGSPPTSGNAFGPRGAILTAVDTFNPLTKPPHTARSTPGSPVGGKRLVYSDHTQAQVRNTNYRICGFNVPNTPSSGGWIMRGDPTFNNRGRDDIALDRVDGVAWVRTASKEGLVFVGQITDVVAGADYGSDTVPHVWYGPENTTCPHRQPAQTEGTGPKSGSMVPMFWIFDPAVVARSDQPRAASEGRLVGGNLPSQVSSDQALGGLWFDEGAGRLYVTLIHGAFEGEPRPTIHVLQIR